MRILFTGGGSGGHFYPIIAIAEALRAKVEEEKITGLKLYFMSTSPYDPEQLLRHQIIYKRNTAGKMRLYFSLLNFTDFFRMVWGTLTALVSVFLLYPDVVVGKGGYASFPALFAARIFGIPVVIHESDTVPGKVNRWAGKFAERIALSYKAAYRYFPEKKTAVTGHPIRLALREGIDRASALHLFSESGNTTPVILVIGGSQGSQLINDIMLDILPRLLEHYVIIHQTGRAHFNSIKSRARVVLENVKAAPHYHLYPYLNDEVYRAAGSAASLAISRAGSGLFELANFGIPTIVVPITVSAGNHQQKNALSFAEDGASIIIEEPNFTGNLLLSEIDRIFKDTKEYVRMKDAARLRVNPGAATQIADEIVSLALLHEN